MGVEEGQMNCLQKKNKTRKYYRYCTSNNKPIAIFYLQTHLIKPVTKRQTLIFKLFVMHSKSVINHFRLIKKS